ncbi:MAG: hypothetical protein M3Q51_06755 [Pseudomonadota bacterium]|nr:hypothetical protein [Pseudomonadota bacterium]MDQ3160709.1 hypothetical protein [Pseudomonadota bacterium]
MSTTEPVPVRTRRGRLVTFATVVVILLALLAIAASFMLQPQRASAQLLDRVGTALGLRITASGQASYRLRGTPQLVLRNVIAQRPGDARAVLRAERVFISLPWSTIRARGADLTVQRLELDAPILDLPALQRWQATRLPGESRIPTLTDGLRIVRGRFDNNGWRIQDLVVDLPALAPGKPLDAHVQGRFVDPPTSVPFDLDVDLTKPANNAGLAVSGTLTLEANGWKLPTRIKLSGPLRVGDAGVTISPVSVGLSARYISAKSDLPFVLGAAGRLRLHDGVWALDPASLDLRGQRVIPDAIAEGALALGGRLVLRLRGDIAAWPDAWPVLPPPLQASKSPMRFALDYVGRLDFSEVTSLVLRRDDTTFDARFKLPMVLEWIDLEPSSSPLPPLRGRLQTPRLEIAGATLEGVEVEFSDDAVPAPDAP